MNMFENNQIRDFVNRAIDRVGKDTWRRYMSDQQKRDRIHAEAIGILMMQTKTLSFDSATVSNLVSRMEELAGLSQGDEDNQALAATEHSLHKRFADCREKLTEILEQHGKDIPNAPDNLRMINTNLRAASIHAGHPGLQAQDLANAAAVIGWVEESIRQFEMHDLQNEDC